MNNNRDFNHRLHVLAVWLLCSYYVSCSKSGLDVTFLKNGIPLRSLRVEAEAITDDLSRLNDDAVTNHSGVATFAKLKKTKIIVCDFYANVNGERIYVANCGNLPRGMTVWGEGTYDIRIE